MAIGIFLVAGPTAWRHRRFSVGFWYYFRHFLTTITLSV